MKTLKDIIIGLRCRNGSSAGTTKHGAFWLAVNPIEIRSYGGDGIGNNDTDRRNRLQLRHYRDGTVKAVVNFHGWHQNRGTFNTYCTAASLLDCVTIEDVIVILKGVTHDEMAAYGQSGEKSITAALGAIGMPEAAPAPDE